MLRKDTSYMLNLHWEPKVPSEETIKKQTKGKHLSCKNSTRLYLGKITTKKNSIK